MSGQITIKTLKFAKWLLPVVGLTAIAFICFGRTLNSYFVADDFGQVAYAGSIVKGNLNALLSNFTGNYLQCPVMRIYRPCLLLSLIIDYALWGTNAFGYFLSDILTFAASSVMLYFLLRELTTSWEKSRSILFSLLSSALFASNPLHCESISFVSGRDNVISSAFYLLTLWCFVRRIKHRNKILLLIGIISFWIALLSKEAAIGLPLVLTGMGFFLPEIFSSKASNGSMPTSQSSDQHTLNSRLRLAMAISTPLWLNTVIYFVVRFLALGTLTGGYVGGFGSYSLSALVSRWTDINTIIRILYPLNLEVFGSGSSQRAILSTLYASLATLILIRLVNGKYHLGWLGLLALWTFTAAAPLYQLWGLGLNLEGARFFFFLSIPLSIFLPLLLLAPSSKFDTINNAGNGDTTVESKNIKILSAVALSALVLLSTNITCKNNIPWVHAGKTAKACLLDGQRLAKATAQGKKVVLLGIPKQDAGAHIIYNGATFNTMMSPPFSSADYSEKFLTFDPIFYGAFELINTQRFRRALSDPDVVGLFAWNEKLLRFEKLRYPARSDLLAMDPAKPIQFTSNEDLAAFVTSHGSTIDCKGHQMRCDDCGLWLSQAAANPYRYDFLEVKLKAAKPKEPIDVFWKGSALSTTALCRVNYLPQEVRLGTTSMETMRIRLSDHWRWFTQGELNNLQLAFPSGRPCQIEDLRLVSARGLIPTITVINAQANNMGVYSIGKGDVELTFDGSSVECAASIKIEISKTNYFFEELDDTASKEATLTTSAQSGRKGQITIPGKVFIPSGYYQLRAYCLDDNGKPIGERSDPVTIMSD